MLATQARRRTRRRRRGPTPLRLLPVLALAAVAFVAGAMAGADRPEPERGLAARYARAWAAGDYAAMHALLTPAARRRHPLVRFARAHESAARTATARALATGRPGPRRGDGSVDVPVTVRTAVFGTVRSIVRIPFEAPDLDGERVGIAWQPHLAFPGLRAGERVRRRTRLAPRAPILTRDGEALAEGELRTSALGPLAAEVAGRMGPIPEERAEDYDRLGFPRAASVGLTGLEREFDLRLAGTPGGTLLAGRRVLARSRPERGRTVRASIDAELQRAGVLALGGRLGGAAVLDPRTGEILALAGIASSAPQPPGSVFKIITLAAALETGVAKRSDRFPVGTHAILEGVKLENANGESCGGTLRNSFAHSCNSVFGPLGAEVGAERLVAMAERFGFNAQPPVAFAASSTLPPASEVGDDLAVGSTAIGQGRVLATPLQMASVAGVIAQRGILVRPTLEARPERPRRRRLLPARVARTVGRYMVAVVREGTGTAAALPGATVAGKTGTAELRTTQGEEVENQQPETGDLPRDEAADTNAWFVAYAPHGRPRVAVAVMFVGGGTGGETAAPAARQILAAALNR